LTRIALLPLDTARVVVPVPDAWGTAGALVLAMVLVLVIVMVADIGPGCYRAKGEPDETGGTAEHVIALGIVVPVVRVLPMVMWHMMFGK